MSTALALAPRIERTPLVEINGLDIILDAADVDQLRACATYLGAGRWWLPPFAGGSAVRQSVPVTVPTLDALVSEPAIFDTLSAPTQAAVYVQVAALEARLRAQLLAQRTAPAVAPRDHAVRIEEAAELLGMTLDFLYRNWQKLGGYKDDDGHVKFALYAIQRHISHQVSRRR
jgi:hypothetical protein